MSRRRGAIPGALLALVTAAALASGPWPGSPTAHARELWREGDRVLSLRTSLTSTLLLSRAPDDPFLFPDRDAAESFWRLRFEGEAKTGAHATFSLAYEHRARAVAHGEAGGLPSGILPEEAPAPYRVRQLDWAITTPPGLSWRHEIDRASVALHARRAEITLGRQAIGWGRGVLFGAVDLFAPFSPLEADREWRRGVDAVRADVRVSDRASVDGVAAFADRLDQSAFAARLRGYAGRADGELIVGSRARDAVAGMTGSAAVGEAEAHGELAYFRTPDAVPGAGRGIVKGVAGASYRFGVGNGLPLFLEYHYSGFGIADAREVLVRLQDFAYRERFLRGDSQVLARHAVALLGTYEVSTTLTAGLTALVAPSDGSGVIEPEATYQPGDRLSFRAILYVPFGAGPRGVTLGSFYGATPLSAYVRVRWFD